MIVGRRTWTLIDRPDHEVRCREVHFERRVIRYPPGWHGPTESGGRTLGPPHEGWIECVVMVESGSDVMIRRFKIPEI